MNRWYQRKASAWLAAAAAGAVALASAAHGQDALLNKLVEKGYLNQREANEIRAQMGQEGVENNAIHNPTKLASWIDEMKWSNDLRLRIEYFDNADQSNMNDRWRFRYRLRIGFTTKFTKWATIGVRLASGSANDPVSTNETFDDSFAKDPIQIDLAYITLQPPDVDWLSVTGGKMKNPIWQTKLNSPMVYDNDVTPEGLSEQLVHRFGEKDEHGVYLTAAQFVLNEIGSSGDTDGFLYEVQGGGEVNFDQVKGKLAAGFLWTQNVDTGSMTGDSPNRGNSIKVVGTTTNYLADFEIVYVRGELGVKVCDRPFLGTPSQVSIASEYVKNLNNAYKNLNGATSTASTDQTQGYTAQVMFGSAKKKGEWQVAYQYKHLEADAVWDALTDSDFGLGGTDRKGHIIKAAYNLQDWWQLGFAAFITEKISNHPNSGEHTRGLRGQDLLRVQIDNVFKF